MRMFAAAAASLLASASALADYAFVQIDYPGAPSTSVFGINERGEVAGYGFPQYGAASPENAQAERTYGEALGLSGVPTSFVYDWRRDRFTEMSAAPGMATYVLGINDSGAMVGSVDVSELGNERAFLRRPDGTYSIFTHPAAHSRTDARAVNASGLITGFRDTPDGDSVGFIYDPAAESFVDFVPSRLTIAHGINSAGQVVGSATFDERAPCPEMAGGRYGWLRAVDGTITFFQVNREHTAARAINDAGLIAGSVSDRDTGHRRGFIVKLGEASLCQSLTVPDSQLLEFPGYDSTIPEGLTDSGVVVGNVFENNGETVHGFIATPR